MSRNQSATTSEIVYGKISPKIYKKSIWKSQQHHNTPNWIIYIAIYKYWNSLNETTRKSRSPKLTPSPFFLHTARISPRIGRALSGCSWRRSGKGYSWTWNIVGHEPWCFCWNSGFKVDSPKNQHVGPWKSVLLENEFPFGMAYFKVTFT